MVLNLYRNFINLLKRTWNSMILDTATINQLKENKSLITFELLEALRAKGNEGKQICLDILDTKKDEEDYYLDAFGGRITYKSERDLKKAFTRMNLDQIHIDEIKRCASDFNYFRSNYLKIKTPTSGISFPDFRPYQDEFIEHILNPYEKLISLQPRQAGKSVTIGSWLSWEYTFDHDKDIGICGNDSKCACEVLDKVKNMLNLLPMWMKVGTTIWNLKTIANENKMRIMTSASTSKNPFRGFTCSIIIVDECAFYEPQAWKTFKDAVFPSQSGLPWKKNIIISTANGINHFSEIWNNSEKRKLIKNVKPTETVQLNDGKIITIEEYYKNKCQI